MHILKGVVWEDDAFRISGFRVFLERHSFAFYLLVRSTTNLLMKEIIILLLSAFALATAITAQEKRPNILFVFSDDHAPHAIGAYEGWLKSVNPTPVIDQSPGLPLVATPAFAGLFADAFIGDADLGLRHPLVTPTLQMLIRFLEAAASGSHQCLGKDSLHVWSVQQLRQAARQLSSVFRGTIALDTRLQATTTASSEFTVRICGEGRPRGIGLRIV